MVHRFGRNLTELCLVFNEMLDLIYTNHCHRLRNWDRNPFLQPGQLHRYADAIHLQGSPLENCFGFVDGTVRSVACPTQNEPVMYNGHKQVDSIKCQIVVTPNSLIANMSGPFEGKRHDNTILGTGGNESGLLTDTEVRSLLQWGATLFVWWPCLSLQSTSPETIQRQQFDFTTYPWVRSEW